MELINTFFTVIAFLFLIGLAFLVVGVLAKKNKLVYLGTAFILLVGLLLIGGTFSFCSDILKI